MILRYRNDHHHTANTLVSQSNPHSPSLFLVFVQQERYSMKTYKDTSHAWLFLHHLYMARYRPLIQLSEFPLIQWPDSEPAICESEVSPSSKILSTSSPISPHFQTLQRHLQEIPKFDQDIQLYSRSVEQQVGKLPWQTRALWLGNLVEQIFASNVGADLVARLLLENVLCLRNV